MASTLMDRLARQASGDQQLSFDPTGKDQSHLLELPLAAIDPDPNQPRRDLGNLTDLALSIREHGLIQPIIVEPTATQRYRILAGERRFAACKSLGWDSLPCIVRSVEEQARLTLQIIENIHRQDLHPLEEARALRRLMDEFNLSQREVARRVHRSPAAVNQILRVLDLPLAMQASAHELAPTNKSVLLEIAKERDPTRQQVLWDQAKAGELTVRKARPPKPATPKPVNRLSTIELDDVTIRVEFHSGEASDQRALEALTVALRRLTEGSGASDRVIARHRSDV